MTSLYPALVNPAESMSAVVETPASLVVAASDGSWC